MRLVAWLFTAGVATAHAAPDFLIEAAIDPGVVYVESEAILRLRLLRAPGVPYGVLRPPVLGDAAEVWPLDRVRWYEESRNGAAWQVHERTYLILPRRAGRIEIPGAEVEGPLRHAIAGGDKSAKPSARTSLRGPPVRLEVRPAPPSAMEPWLPARKVTLEESWSHEPATLSIGTPVTRTVTLRVEGLPSRRLPLPPRFGHPALRVHHDQPEFGTAHQSTGTVSRVSQRVVLVALEEAEVALPEIRVHWWDVVADVPRVTTLAARTLRLQAPASLPATVAVTETPAPSIESDAAARAGAAVFALLLALWLWWGARTHAPRDARRKLREACLKNNARGARDALAEWWAWASPGEPLPLVSRMGDAWSPEAQLELRSLDAALYGKRSWDGRKFWRSVRPWLRKKNSRPEGLVRPESFFRLQAPASDARAPR